MAEAVASTQLPELWPHQAAGVDWIQERRASYMHLTMGAGKSRIVVAAADRVNAQSVLVVCPKSVVDSVWPGQFADWSSRPWAVVPLTRGGATVARRCERAAQVIQRAVYDSRPYVVVVNYEAMRTPAALKWLRTHAWDLVVFDEAQKLKSPQGKASKAAAAICRSSADRVVMLSGTPMPHSPMDVWAQFRALDSDVFGLSFVRFRARYAQLGGYKMKQVVGFQRQDELTEKMSGLMYSPPDDAVQLNLPSASHISRTVELSPKAARLYSAMQDDLTASCSEGTISYQNGLVKLLRMQQLCSGLAVVDPPEETVDGLDDEAIAALLEDEVAATEQVVVCNAKRDALVDILSESDEPVVVFGQFRRDLDIVHDAVRELGNDDRCSELSGRSNELAAWKAGDTRVLAAQIATGAEGIDLTRARICVYLSTGFNMGTYLQSLARCHRPGQSRPVLYYHIHAKDTVDQVVYSVLQSREDLVRGVLQLMQSNAT